MRVQCVCFTSRPRTLNACIVRRPQSKGAMMATPAELKVNQEPKSTGTLSARHGAFAKMPKSLRVIGARPCFRIGDFVKAGLFEIDAVLRAPVAGKRTAVIIYARCDRDGILVYCGWDPDPLETRIRALKRDKPNYTIKVTTTKTNF